MINDLVGFESPLFTSSGSLWIHHMHLISSPAELDAVCLLY